MRCVRPRKGAFEDRLYHRRKCGEGAGPHPNLLSTTPLTLPSVRGLRSTRTRVLHVLLLVSALWSDLRLLNGCLHRLRGENNLRCASLVQLLRRLLAQRPPARDFGGDCIESTLLILGRRIQHDRLGNRG